MNGNLILIAGTAFPSKEALHKQEGSLKKCSQNREVRREAEELRHQKQPGAWFALCDSW